MIQSCWKLKSGVDGIAQFATEGQYLNVADFIRENLGAKDALSYLQTKQLAGQHIDNLFFQMNEPDDIDMDNIANGEVILVMIIGITPRWYFCQAKVVFNQDGCWITNEELERHC